MFINKITKPATCFSSEYSTFVLNQSIISDNVNLYLNKRAIKHELHMR